MAGTRRPKSPWLALLLSGVVPGLGQIYAGRWLKGAGFLVGTLVLTEIVTTSFPLEAILGGAVPEPVWPVLTCLALLVALLIWCLWDAYRSAI